MRQTRRSSVVPYQASGGGSPSLCTPSAIGWDGTNRDDRRALNTLKCLVSLGLCVGITACGGGESPNPALQAASEDCAAAPTVYRHAIDDRPVATRTMPGHGVVVATGVIARDGCSSIDGPLAAVNWWTTNDKPLLEEKYDSVVGPLALRHARIIFAGDSREVIRAAEAQLLDHETLAVVLYHSAESFSEMSGRRLT